MYKKTIPVLVADWSTQRFSRTKTRSIYGETKLHFTYCIFQQNDITTNLLSCIFSTFLLCTA